MRRSTHDRGYGWNHQKQRAKWEPRVKAGEVNCWRCGQPIHPNAKWDLGHDDNDRTIYRGPEHVGRECPAGGNRGNTSNTKRRTRPTALNFFNT